MFRKRESEWQVGDKCILVEEGGAAWIEILERTVNDGYLKYKIRFRDIIVQYPFTPYHPGDEITIGFRLPDPYGIFWIAEDESEIAIMRG